DDDAVVFRLLEAAGRAANARVVLNTAVFGPIADAVEVDLLERPIENPTARFREDSFSVEVPAHGIASVKVSLRT
ncbi:MAG: glycosyl hydrolase-related protein, partial [Phycisphaerae bacterium]